MAAAKSREALRNLIVAPHPICRNSQAKLNGLARRSLGDALRCAPGEEEYV